MVPVCAIAAPEYTSRGQWMHSLTEAVD